jgi:hypothetical protein
MAIRENPVTHKVERIHFSEKALPKWLHADNKVVDVVTLEVTPDQAEKIDLARSIGTLSLVRRNQVDPQAAATAGATRSTLLDVAASAPAPAPRVIRKVAAREPANCVRVIVGGETVDVSEQYRDGVRRRTEDSSNEQAATSNEQRATSTNRQHATRNRQRHI